MDDARPPLEAGPQPLRHLRADRLSVPTVGPLTLAVSASLGRQFHQNWPLDALLATDAIPPTSVQRPVPFLLWLFWVGLHSFFSLIPMLSALFYLIFSSPNIWDRPAQERARVCAAAK